MKNLKKWLTDYFSPEEFNDLDIGSITEALNDFSVRGLWLSDILQEFKRINREVDKRLLSGSDLGLLDLCARRKAYQDVLESILSARRVVMQGSRPNPAGRVVAVDLDRVTA